MREVHVLGVGATSFPSAGRAPERPARAAAAAALADAGITASEIGAIVVTRGNRGPGDVEALAGSPDQVLAPAPASGVAALHLAYEAVAGGAHDVVLCVGHQGAVDASAVPVDELAAAAAAYMRASGATERTFALVAAKNRTQGMANPRALHAGAVDADTVLRSELVVWPLHRLMVASPAQGAAAIVLAAAERRRPGRGPRAPRVRAAILVRSTDGVVPRSAIARAAGLAYRSAHVGPEDIDCAELHDLSAAGEVAAYEALQFAPEGQGPDLVDSGFTALGGVLPVNTSGGSLAQGEATGASAIAQLCELAWQLRGEAGRRQVPGAHVALALSTGPGVGGAAHVGVAILTSG